MPDVSNIVPALSRNPWKTSFCAITAIALIIFATCYTNLSGCKDWVALHKVAFSIPMALAIVIMGLFFVYMDHRASKKASQALASPTLIQEKQPLPNNAIDLHQQAAAPVSPVDDRKAKTDLPKQDPLAMVPVSLGQEPVNDVEQSEQQWLSSLPGVLKGDDDLKLLLQAVNHYIQCNPRKIPELETLKINDGKDYDTLEEAKLALKDIKIFPIFIITYNERHFLIIYKNDNDEQIVHFLPKTTYERTLLVPPFKTSAQKAGFASPVIEKYLSFAQYDPFTLMRASDNEKYWDIEGVSADNAMRFRKWITVGRRHVFNSFLKKQLWGNELKKAIEYFSPQSMSSIIEAVKDKAEWNIPGVTQGSAKTLKEALRNDLALSLIM